MSPELTLEQSRLDALRSVKLEVQSLLQGRQIGDPKLYEAILLLNHGLDSVITTLAPPQRRSQGAVGISESLAAPTGFRVFTSSTRRTVRLEWDQVDFGVFYEVRRGIDWDSASFVFRTSGLSGDIDPLPYGAYVFLIKAVDANGDYSAGLDSAVFEVPVIPGPAVTHQVIDNNILLYWTPPPSIFSISYYVVTRETGGGIPQRVDSTFVNTFEVVAGTYTYSVYAVDIAGNIGDKTFITTEVNQPPDFALQESRVSTLMGARVNVIRRPQRPSLLAPWEPQTWQEHFIIVHGPWNSPKEQVDASYPIYIQPSDPDGTYTEVFDFGAVIQNTIVNVNWNEQQIVPSEAVTVECYLEVSLDGVAYQPPVHSTSSYFTELRYVRLKLAFHAADDHSFIDLYNLTINLSVKRENDGGKVTSLASDVGGTLVLFNKPFKDIESITVTPLSVTEPFVAIFDFLDIPSPTGFRVYAFDTVGYRVTREIDWKARGIV